MKTLYDVLEVSNSASKDTIDASYHRFVEEFQARFESGADNQTEIRLRLDAAKRAYTVLSDPIKRREYDERIIEGFISRGRLENQYSDGIFSDLFDYLKKPLAFAAALLIPIVSIGYLMSDHDIKSESVATMERNDIRYNERKSAETDAQERVATSDLKIVEKSADQAHALRKEQLELENERLKLSTELARLEQERKSRELEYRANAGDRVLRMEERRVETQLSEVNAERKHSNEVYADERVQSNIDNINRTIELIKDSKAAQLGLTRRQYDSLRQNE